MWRTMFSIITIASSTTKPVPMVSAISDRLSSEKPAEPHHPEGRDQRQRQRDAGDDGRADGAQEDEHHQHHEADREHQRELHVADRGADRVGAVVHHGRAWRRRAGCGCSRGSSCWMRWTVCDHVGAGLALDVDDHGRLAVVPAGDPVVLQPVDDLGDVAQQHRRAVAIGDDQRAVGLGGGELVVGRDGVGLERRRRTRPSGRRRWR